ncbi:MAG: response regulator [Bacteroidia bacterium]|nr:response regulator [Bacteroidia bacterium]
MESLRIGIIEDEILIADNIAMHISHMGHEVVGTAGHFQQALELAEGQKPDLLLVDIRLKGSKSGLDVARELMEKHNIPFLFLTSNTDKGTIKRAMETLPLGYITKPFTFDDLFIAIELVRAKIQLGKPKGKKIEIKNGTQIQWVPLNDILYLEAARSYVTIFLVEGSIVLRQPLGNILSDFSAGDMVRIHRSFAVNPTKVESVTGTRVIVAGNKIPIGPGYREEFLAWMRSSQTGQG